MIKYLLLISCFFSCVSSRKLIDGYSVIRYKEHIGVSSEIQDYLLDVPKGGRLIKQNSGDGYRQYVVQFSDSSIVYIMNDSWSGSRLNIQNRYNSNIMSINRKSNSDTLIFSGKQKNGNYWKEKILGKIVVGYVNVNPSEKQVYDTSIESIRIYK